MKDKRDSEISAIIWFAIAIAVNLVTKFSFFDTFLTKLLFVFSGDSISPDKVVNTKEIIKSIIDLTSLVPAGIKTHKNGVVAKKHNETVELLGRKYIEEFVLLANNARNGNLIDSIKINIHDISARVFLLKNNELWLHDIPGCCNNIIYGDLKFSLKRDEGVVSKAYKTNKIWTEIDNCLDDQYNLPNSVQAKVNALKFIMAIPILDDDGKNTKAIICFDSDKKIISSSRGLETVEFFAKNLAYNIYEYVWGDKNDN